MVKKTKALCKKCKWHTKLGQGHGEIACYYVALAHHSRTIVEGYCLEFEKETKKNENRLRDL